jgi:NAD(P)-dependent dehydrogenase (short-subunit alcohol dehydrogenase family)
MDGYRAPMWMPGGNVQTIWPALFGRRHFGPALTFRRERWTTPDSDFVDADWQEAIDHTLMPAIRMSKLVVPHMQQRGGGAIVIIASIFGREAGGRMTYNAVKAAEISLGKSLAQQLASVNIRVNSVAPAPPNRDRVWRGALTVYATEATIEVRGREGVAFTATDLTYGLPEEQRDTVRQRISENGVPTHRGDVTLSSVKGRI